MNLGACTKPLACLVAAILLPEIGVAQIMHSYVAEITFSGQAPSDDVAWSEALRLSQEGLIAESEGNFVGRTFRPNWIQTQPIPADVSWRLPSAATVTVDVRGNVSVPTLSRLVERDRRAREPDSQYATRELAEISFVSLRAFVRYGIDRVHWSSWHYMPEASGAEPGARRFRADIQLPSSASEEFDRVWREWETTKPVWVDDEHALCVWIATHHPGFFSGEIPRIGYIEVRLEGLSRGMTLSSLEVRGGGSASGFSSGGGRPTFGEVWHFDLTEHRP